MTLDTDFKPAWKSRNVPLAKNAVPMIGTIHGTLAAEVHPNQNMEIGSRIPPNIATGRRLSGMKSAQKVESTP